MNVSDLQVGSVYKNSHGNMVEYLKLDRCWGETTFKFRRFNHPEPDYVKPENIEAYLKPPAEATTATAKVKVLEWYEGEGGDWCAASALGLYRCGREVQGYRVELASAFLGKGFTPKRTSNLEDAKEIAQADFSERILACLAA